MKVFLDDLRTPPEGWVLTKTVQETLTLLKTCEVTHLSLDHDLGSLDETGYDVVKWIETVVVFGFVPPIITVHSSNPVGRIRMQAGIESIKKIEKALKEAGEKK